MSHRPHPLFVLLSLSLLATACGKSIVTIDGKESVDMAQAEDLGTARLDMRPIFMPKDMRAEEPDLAGSALDMRPIFMPEDMARPPELDMGMPEDMRMQEEDMRIPEEDMRMEELDMRPAGPPPSDSVETVKNQACTTGVVKGLSQQLIEEMNCISPGLMGGIDHIAALNLYSVVFPYLQAPAATSLDTLMAGRTASSVRISSALRTVPQQYLLYRWYREGRCGIGLAASPGNSNHNGALAIDSPDYNAIKTSLTSNGWRWLGSSDTVHFDYQAGGTDIRSLSVLAFQRLWNRNNINDTLTEDGDYGPQTEARLKSAPSQGFPIVPWCPSTAIHPLSGVASASFLIHQGWWSLLAPSSVRHVEYSLNGEIIAAASRQQGWPNLAAWVGEPAQGEMRIAMLGEEGDVLRTTYAQVRADGVRIMPVGAGLYEVSVDSERDILGLDVLVDGVRALPDPTAPAHATSGVYALGRDLDLSRVEVRLLID